MQSAKDEHWHPEANDPIHARPADPDLFVGIFRFRDLALARSFAGRCHKIQAIVLGDVPEYWVVTPAHAMRLQHAGYEVLAWV